MTKRKLTLPVASVSRIRTAPNLIERSTVQSNRANRGNVSAQCVAVDDIQHAYRFEPFQPCQRDCLYKSDYWGFDASNFENTDSHRRYVHCGCCRAIPTQPVHTGRSHQCTDRVRRSGISPLCSQQRSQFLNTMLPLSQYSQLSSLTEANDVFLRIACHLAE